MRNGDYELVVAPNDYPGKKYRGRHCCKHHLVWWQETGEIVKSGEVVHHKNGDKYDNRFENLEKMSLKKHATLHSSTGRTMIKLVCAFCGKEFMREARNVNSRITHGQTDFYCNRSCVAHAFGRGRPKT